MRQILARDGYAVSCSKLRPPQRTAARCKQTRRPNTELASSTAGSVTIVAHDIGSLGGMERVLAELVIGLVGLGHDVTVIARTCVLPPNVKVSFHRIAGPARPVLLAYPWFMLAGSLALRRRRRGVVQTTGAIVLNRVDVIAVHYCHQVGPANPSRSSKLYRLHARLVGVCCDSASECAFAQTVRPRSWASRRAWPRRCARTIPALAERVVTIHNGVDTDGLCAPAARGRGARCAALCRSRAGRHVAAFVGSEWERKGLRAGDRALAFAPGWDLVVAGGR